jgi:hypothetical protein
LPLPLGGVGTGGAGGRGETGVGGGLFGRGGRFRTTVTVFVAVVGPLRATTTIRFFPSRSRTRTLNRRRPLGLGRKVAGLPLTTTWTASSAVPLTWTTERVVREPGWGRNIRKVGRFAATGAAVTTRLPLLSVPPHPKRSRPDAAAIALTAPTRTFAS